MIFVTVLLAIPTRLLARRSKKPAVKWLAIKDSYAHLDQPIRIAE